MRARGGRVVLVPGAVVVDQRPVRSRRELRVAADPAGSGWAAAVRRSGAVLRRSADRRADVPRLFALTVAAPSAKVAGRWGDWHLAEALAGSLRRVGHEVRVQTADQAASLAGRACDVHVVLRGLQPVRASEGQRQVLWIISHPEAVEDRELDEADVVLVASPRFAEHVRRRTASPVEVMLQATDHRRFAPRPVDPAHRHDVTVVAKTRDVLRPVVADALAAGLRPAIYGGGWRELVDPSLVIADHVDNELLPTVYSSAGVVLNDHWALMTAWGFVSNRLFDVLACGTPVISDAVDGIAELFDGAVPEYRHPAELRALVDEVLADPSAARSARRRAVTSCWRSTPWTTEPASWSRRWIATPTSSGTGCRDRPSSSAWMQAPGASTTHGTYGTTVGPGKRTTADRPAGTCRTSCIDDPKRRARIVAG